MDVRRQAGVEDHLDVNSKTACDIRLRCSGCFHDPTRNDDYSIRKPNIARVVDNSHQYSRHGKLQI
jgi:hypothetical protein